jgi:hypothetical protein
VATSGEISWPPMGRTQWPLTWECWAVFDDVELEVVETTPLNREMPELLAVGELFELTVF